MTASQRPSVSRMDPTIGASATDMSPIALLRIGNSRSAMFARGGATRSMALPRESPMTVAAVRRDEER